MEQLRVDDATVTIARARIKSDADKPNMREDDQQAAEDYWPYRGSESCRGALGASL